MSTPTQEEIKGLLNAPRGAGLALARKYGISRQRISYLLGKVKPDHTCQKCNELIPPSLKFCSIECRNRDLTSVCKQCKNEFIRKKKDQVFCDSFCRRLRLKVSPIRTEKAIPEYLKVLPATRKEISVRLNRHPIVVYKMLQKLLKEGLIKSEGKRDRVYLKV